MSCLEKDISYNTSPGGGPDEIEVQEDKVFNRWSKLKSHKVTSSGGRPHEIENTVNSAIHK